MNVMRKRGITDVLTHDTHFLSKSMPAVMQHNLAWFNHYIWGDPLADFTAPELPKKESKDEKKADDK